MDDPMDIAEDVYETTSCAVLPIRDGRCIRNGDEEEGLADEEFSIMASSMVTTGVLNTTSNPVSPGSSSPPRDQTKNTDFVPPTRPSSTPFPNLDHRTSKPCCLEHSGYDTEWQSSLDSPTLPTDESQPLPRLATRLDDLPIEVFEAIFDHLFGYRVSTTSRSSMGVSKVTKSWGAALRHSRRKELTELALVSELWRNLIQQRLYRHVKLKATVDFLQNAMLHFAQHPHLQSYVKHIEIWFPVFQPTYGPLALSNTLTLPTVTMDGLTNATYTLPGNNCTLDDVFKFVGMALPQTRVLTLEGGERRKAPRVVHFHEQKHDASISRPLPVLESVQTLVTRGQWNLMRSDDDFATILKALPNLTDWQGSYSKPKSKSYITMSEFLPQLPHNITNLNLCLESDYRREGVVPAFYSKVVQKTHICMKMAEALPALEHFAYTGRVCHQFFDMAMRSTDPRTSKLKSIDLTVKNCCRCLVHFQESGSGIQDMGFIDAFEKLVVAGIRSLEKFKALEYLRIRFVDLDSVLPPLNPFFIMRKSKCSGVWSNTILTELSQVRPDAAFTELSESFGNIIYNKDGRMVITPEYPRTRITSLKIDNYKSLAIGINHSMITTDA
ncbi:Fc.00g022890.m01.CDS01 [Cosmosporella sp. VM-42]